MKGERGRREGLVKVKRDFVRSVFLFHSDGF